DRPDGVAQVLEHALAELHQALGGGRHPDLTAHTQKQRLAELFLEEENLPADGRLRHVQFPPAGRERSRLRDRLEEFERTKAHLQCDRTGDWGLGAGGWDVFLNDTPRASGPSTVTMNATMKTTLTSPPIAWVYVNRSPSAASTYGMLAANITPS